LDAVLASSPDRFLDAIRKAAVFVAHEFHRKITALSSERGALHVFRVREFMVGLSPLKRDIPI
jgi:hypothetical protein